MSRVWTLWTLASKGQRSRSQCKDYWKWFLAHNCFPFTPFFMKLHMQSPHESSMDPMDFGVKRSKVKVTMQGLLYPRNEVRGGGYTGITMSVRLSVRLSVRPSVRPHLGFRRITAFPLHLSSWNFTCRLPMSQGCALYILRSKGQRSMSQCINYWKWFPAHNYFPFTPIIMKLHMQTPHESRMCPIHFEVKRSKVKVTMHKLLNCFPFTPIIMKLHMQTPHESRMCPIDFEVKRSEVKVTMHKLLKMVSGA